MADPLENLQVELSQIEESERKLLWMAWPLIAPLVIASFAMFAGFDLGIFYWLALALCLTAIPISRRLRKLFARKKQIAEQFLKLSSET
ncbi:MAG: hypothetical protein ACU0GG_13690 [Paracoccaceae bacterium]